MTALQAQEETVLPLRADLRLVRSPEVLWRAIPGVAVVIARPQGNRDIVLLSGTGLTLWEELRDPTCLLEIATRLADLYGARPDDVMEGLAGVILELRDQGIVLVHEC